MTTTIVYDFDLEVSADSISASVEKIDEWCRSQSSEHVVTAMIFDELIIQVPEYDAERSSIEIAKIVQTVLHDVSGK